jgi:four helix bundle protein
VAEAQGAPTKADFIHKNFIALKEARETLYWLKLIQSSVEECKNIEHLIEEAGALGRIIGAIVTTARKNLRESEG